MRFDFDMDAAIFDMDGTLLDTMPYWRYTPLEFLLAHQLPVDPALLPKLYTSSSRKTIAGFCEQYGLDGEAAAREAESFMNRHYLYDAHLKTPAVPAFLAHLKERGAHMCVATAAPREYAKNGLRRLAILEYFDFVTDNRESGLNKRQPEYFLNLLKRMGSAPERSWVFEDALYAMKSAKSAGLRVCAIEDGTQVNDREEIRQIADVYIQDYIELM